MGKLCNAKQFYLDYSDCLFLVEVFGSSDKEKAEDAVFSDLRRKQVLVKGTVTM